MPRPTAHFLRLAIGALALSLLGSTLAQAQAAAPTPAKTGHAKSAAAEPDEVGRGRKIAERIQRYYGKRRDFSATFAQRYTYAALGRTEEKSGTVQVKRPGLLRWEYLVPDKKLLILDGKSFWQWVPDDNQVTVKRDLHGEQLSAAFTFLWGKGDLLTEFTPRAVSLPDGLPSGDAIELVPKKDGGSVQKILFCVDKSGRVLASQVTDGQGNENRLVFGDAKIDQKLGDALFQFTPPAGANVQELP